MSQQPPIDISPENWQIVHEILKRHVPDREVWAFGSRATWTAKEYSDLDLAILGDQPLSLSALAELRDAFQESELPFKVDVVDWAATKPSFRRAIESSRVTLHPQPRKSVKFGVSVERLGDAAEIVMGQSPDGRSVSAFPVGLPLLNGPTEFGRHHPYPKQYTNVVLRRARAGDILFCVRGSTTGRMNWADREYAIGRGLAAIRHKHNAALQPVLRAIIETALPALLAKATGSTFPNLAASQIADIPFPRMNERELTLIARIIGTLDEKIELNQRVSETLEAVARALFKSWFVDFDPVRAKAEGRDPGLRPEIAALFPDSFEDSELGEIPKGWGIAHVGSITDPIRATISPAAFRDEPMSHYSIPAFDAGRLPIKQVGSQIRSNKFSVPQGSVLLSRLNPTTPRVWMPQEDGTLRSICSTEFAVMVPHIVSREWLYGLFSSAEFCGRFAAMVTGTSGSHQRVKPDSLAAMPVVSPPKSVAERFTDFASPVFSRAQRCLSESQTLVTLRNALLPKLISGEIRVSDAERLVEQAV